MLQGHLLLISKDSLYPVLGTLQTDRYLQRNKGFRPVHLEKGIDKLQINKIKIKEDLDTSWEVLTEAIQTVLRKHLIPNGYELMKDLSRGKAVNKKALMNLIDELAITEEDKIILRQLSPSTYIGMAKKLAKDI